ncbi:MAG TPA: M48 family metalloprotease [Candidatus Limnocylindrales bacterium]|jgi:predicted Zn-dependent protease|nr:M48 family metalloprotease [Candidatus Limnocylindrales bacterium]
MKRFIAFVLLVTACGAIFYFGRRQKPDTRVGAQGILNAVADTQREISRIPAQITRLSDEEEIRIGDSMAANYLSHWHVANTSDAEMQDYVRKVGSAVSGRARRHLPYKFHYVADSGFVNAFALPGGHVFIGQGLIKLMKSEDELASVLGHEVEHVDNYHCAERVQVEARLRHLPLGELVALPMELFQAGYSKEQELEADRDGTTLAVMAGYSAEGAIHLFQTFAKLHKTYLLKAGSPDEELSKVAIQGLTDYFRSHPLPEEREAQIKNMVRRARWPERAERPLKVTTPVHA